MQGELRKMGIDNIGDVPWGTHACQFYQSKEDLFDMLVPYFKAGLENNEFCLWITSEPLREEEAKEGMKTALPNFHKYLRRGQIEIIAYTQWYLQDGVFNSQRVLNGWVDKLSQALEKGYDGLRVTGNTFWIGKRGWREFTGYEEEVNNGIGKYQIIALCAYSLDKCGGSEVIDVVNNHQFALIKREGKWELRESSERKRAEKALRESEKMSRLLVDNANEIIFIIQDGVIKFPNSRTLAFTGYSAEELSKTPFVNLIHPDDRDRVFEEPKRKLAGEKFPSTCSFRIRHKSGEELWVEINAVFIIWEGRPATLNFVRDLTAQREMEGQLQQALKMEALATMVPGLAHELRNPLAIISSCAQFCMGNKDLTPPMNENLHMIYQNSMRANQLIRNLIEFDGSSDLKWRRVNINKVVTMMWQRAKRDMLPFPVSFAAQLEQNLPEVIGDPERLEQVFLNLFLNAIQAVSKKRKVIVQTHYLASENMVMVNVIDNGPGIPKELRQRIFDLFFTTKKEGMGLGLSICRSIVQRHKGSITVDCEGERGTKVCVRLPVAQDEAARRLDNSSNRGGELA